MLVVVPAAVVVAWATVVAVVVGAGAVVAGVVAGTVVGAVVVTTTDEVVVGTVVTVVATVVGARVVMVEGGRLEVVVAGSVVVTGVVDVLWLLLRTRASTMTMIRRAAMAQASTWMATGVDRNRSHGVRPNGGPGGPGGPGGSGGGGRPEMTWVGGGPVAGWATVGATSGGYQRPSASCHQPGPEGRSDMPDSPYPSQGGLILRLLAGAVPDMTRTITDSVVKPSGSVGQAMRAMGTGALLV